MACPAFHSSSKILVLVNKGGREVWTGELFTKEASKKNYQKNFGQKNIVLRKIWLKL